MRPEVALQQVLLDPVPTSGTSGHRTGTNEHRPRSTWQRRGKDRRAYWSVSRRLERAPVAKSGHELNLAAWPKKRTVQFLRIPPSEGSRVLEHARGTDRKDRLTADVPQQTRHGGSTHRRPHILEPVGPNHGDDVVEDVVEDGCEEKEQEKRKRRRGERSAVVTSGSSDPHIAPPQLGAESVRARAG